MDNREINKENISLNNEIYKEDNIIQSLDVDDNIDLAKEEQKLKHKHYIELHNLSHSITKNIYKCLIKLTNEWVLIGFIIIVILLLMPFSKMNGYSIKEYFRYVLESLQTFWTFILGVIISDWVSFKLKK